MSDEPATVPALLRVLDGTATSAHAQRAAIKVWLADHTPNSALRTSLRANGHGLLLTRVGCIGAIAHRTTAVGPPPE